MLVLTSKVTIVPSSNSLLEGVIVPPSVGLEVIVSVKTSGGCSFEQLINKSIIRENKIFFIY